MGRAADGERNGILANLGIPLVLWWLVRGSLAIRVAIAVVVRRQRVGRRRCCGSRIGGGCRARRRSWTPVNVRKRYGGVQEAR